MSSPSSAPLAPKVKAKAKPSARVSTRGALLAAIRRAAASEENPYLNPEAVALGQELAEITQRHREPGHIPTRIPLPILP